MIRSWFVVIRWNQFIFLLVKWFWFSVLLIFFEGCVSIQDVFGSWASFVLPPWASRASLGEPKSSYGNASKMLDRSDHNSTYWKTKYVFLSGYFLAGQGELRACWRSKHALSPFDHKVWINSLLMSHCQFSLSLYEATLPRLPKISFVSLFPLWPISSAAWLHTLMTRSPSWFYRRHPCKHQFV